jgi:hypothetical protein
MNLGPQKPSHIVNSAVNNARNTARSPPRILRLGCEVLKNLVTCSWTYTAQLCATNSVR